MAKILYGAPVREKIKEDLLERVEKLGRKPVLAIFQVGDREDSNIYIRQKAKFGEEIGAEVLVNKFFEISEEELIGEIDKLNGNHNIDGIIAQLPLPQGFDTEKILNVIKKDKDVDGLVAGSEVVPATARGVMELLDFYEMPMRGRRAAIIGQSRLAGKPISDELEKRGAEVLRCDINTPDIPAVARECDILVSAVGKMDLVIKEFVNKRQVVVDVGINRTKEGKLAGDVEFGEVEPLVSAITPVPGGVGPLTVACLFQNLLDLADS